ncbi:GtrA family protein [Bacillus sp. AGMB 02131]|uniref:GtrA family protein n=1 Tax=Peribacillus faecalis TaxID=2772559 RepID=A0A927HBP9_9BACI|nr:GtrA family protein [Peribacillus faecalis]MBD3109194.1 GtrA family protein [Peribacillus faecalis]
MTIPMYNKHKELVLYVVFGVLTTIINFIIYFACVLTFLNPEKSIELQIANVLAWIGAVIFAYITNRKYVFGSKKTNILQEMYKFFGSRIFVLLLEMLLMFIFVSCLGLNDKVMKFLVQAIVIASNYVLSKWVVFTKKGNTV